MKSRQAFSLVELLVVISIIALLLALVVPALAGAKRQANMIRELSAARNLMAAYIMYAEDHDGEVLPGYMSGPAVDHAGNELGNPINKRYPWKLAPYFNYELSDCLLVNMRRADIDALAAKGEDYIYAVSVMPSFGLNTQYVGGNELYGWLPHIKRIDEPAQPNRLITFASARSTPRGPGSEVGGYFEIRPPMDRKYNPSRDAHRFGFLHLRHDDQAAVGLFDGHAEMMGESELVDMRRWSDTAARLGDPDWQWLPPTK